MAYETEPPGVPGGEASAGAAGTAAPFAHLGEDLSVLTGDLGAAANGDVAVVSGLPCLAQGLFLRLGTPRGSLWYDPSYGLDIRRYLHGDATPIVLEDFKAAVKAEVEEDPRVEPGSAVVEVVSWDLERIRFRLRVMPIGSTHPLNLVLEFTSDGSLEALSA